MNMKTILALIIGAVVSLSAQADGDTNYVKLPDYNPNAPIQTTDQTSDHGDDSYGEDTYAEDTPYDNSAPDNYVEPLPEWDQQYSGDDNGGGNWGAVKAACDKRENDPYRISGQLSPLRIQIICTQFSSIDARIQAKGMDTYSVKSQPVQVRRWKKDVLCEDLVNSNYDINVLCGQQQQGNDYDDSQDNYEEETGS